MNRILTFGEYKQKIIELAPDTEQKTEDYRRAYTEYVNSNGERIPRKHNIDLIRDPYFVINQNVRGYFSQFWLILSDLNKYLLKELPDGKFYQNHLDLYSRVNSRVVPKIIRKAGLESAEYYIVNWVMDDSASTWEDDFFLTPSFLKEEDEMLSIKDILGQECLDVEVLEKRLRRELELRKFPKKNINMFIQELRKEICMSEIIDNTDISSENMSVIFNNGFVRMAPMYDFDFCMGNRATANKHFKVKGSCGLKAVLDYYKDDEEIKDWLVNKVSKIDFSQIISKEFTEQSSDSKKHKQKYISFWKQQMQTIEKFIELNQDKEL